MTKTVRIENADTLKGHLVVEVWEVSPHGRADKMVKQTLLMHPTELMNLTLNHCRYIVVRANNGSTQRDRRPPEL